MTALTLEFYHDDHRSCYSAVDSFNIGFYYQKYDVIGTSTIDFCFGVTGFTLCFLEDIDSNGLGRSMNIDHMQVHEVSVI